MENPTLVFLTDRNELDDQLFGQFQRCYEILRQTPVQADSVEHLRKLLNVASGGVVFTTIQKFMPEEKGGKTPELSKRRNIIVIADEAHRSQSRRLTQIHARSSAICLPRLYESASQHLTELRACSHQHLRHPARRGRQGDGPDLLREPRGQAGVEPKRAAEDRRGIRSDHPAVAGRRADAQGEWSGMGMPRHGRSEAQPAGFRSRGQTTGSSSRLSGPRSKRWSGIRSGSTSSPPIPFSTTSAGSKRWKARR